MTKIDIATEPGIEVFWLPGCTSCLRMKEFVEKTGLPFEAVNLDANPERGEKLRAQKVYAPAVCIGDRCVNGGSLTAVAELIGVDYAPPVMLEPAALAAKYRIVLAAACRYIAQMPSEGLQMKLPNRDRDFVGVASQSVSVMRSFLAAYNEDTHDLSFYSTPTHVRTVDDLLERGRETGQLFSEWWERDGIDDPLDRVVPTHWGHRTLHEIFEREVWHTAQHTRQLMLFLELRAIAPDSPLTASDLAGLPLPERVHE
jgi:glutaredoxin